MPVDPFTSGQIRRITEAALRAADVVGTYPTPLDQVAEVAGIAEVLDIGDLPRDLVAAKPRAWRRILGAYLYRADTAFVDLSQPAGRQRFIIGHETGHKILPWHVDSFHLDGDARLFRDTEETLEAEANMAASLLIFQGGRYHERALDFETSMKTPVALASDYGASLHASIRYYAEHHPEPVGLVIAGRHVRSDGTVPIWDAVESRSFTDRFGPATAFFPARGVPLRDATAHPLGTAAKAAYRAAEVVRDRVHLADRAGHQVPCELDVFFNRRCLFVMFTPHRRVRRGRRVDVRAS